MAAPDLPSQEELNNLVLAHERLLSGYVDQVRIVAVPGMIQQVADVRESQESMSRKLVQIEEEIAPLPELVGLTKSARRWARWGIVLIIGGQLALLTHQYNFIPFLIKMFGG